MARTHRDQPNQLTSAWPDVPSYDPVAEVARNDVFSHLYYTPSFAGIRQLRERGFTFGGEWCIVEEADPSDRRLQ